MMKRLSNVLLPRKSGAAHRDKSREWKASKKIETSVNSCNSGNAFAGYQRVAEHISHAVIFGYDIDQAIAVSPRTRTPTP